MQRLEYTQAKIGGERPNISSFTQQLSHEPYKESHNEVTGMNVMYEIEQYEINERYNNLRCNRKTVKEKYF